MSLELQRGPELTSRHAAKDENGISVKEELTRHGFMGDTPSSFNSIPLKAHFELHIEQGPILDEAEVAVGPVIGVQALKWFEIKLQGRGSHAGTTPMSYRHNPLVAFTAIASGVDEVALRHGGLATIGRIWSDNPQSTNCVLDDIVFHLDIRHHKDDHLALLEKDIRAMVEKVVDGAKGVRLDRFKVLNAVPAVDFDPLAVSCVKEACKGFSEHELISGAGHDS